MDTFTKHNLTILQMFESLRGPTSNIPRRPFDQLSSVTCEHDVWVVNERTLDAKLTHGNTIILLTTIRVRCIVDGPPTLLSFVIVARHGRDRPDVVANVVEIPIASLGV